MFEMLEPPYNNDKVITPLYIIPGVIESVNTDTHTAVVNSIHGKFQNVRLPLPYYSKGSGIFFTPSPGDIVIFSLTADNEPFALAFYSLNPEREKNLKERVIPSPHTFVIKTKAGDNIKISTDYKTACIQFFSPSNVEIVVDKGYIISKNKNNSSSIIFDPNKGTCIFKIIDGDGSGLVTHKQLEYVVSQIMDIISNLKILVKLSPQTTIIAGPPIGVPNVIVPGLLGITTEKAENVQIDNEVNDLLKTYTDTLNNINSNLNLLLSTINNISTPAELVVISPILSLLNELNNTLRNIFSNIKEKMRVPSEILESTQTETNIINNITEE